MSGMASVQRHPTMPMTKRDSLGITGSRLSLISTGSNTNPPATKPSTNPPEERDLTCTVNTHPDMVAGKRRSPKKVKRTDSYKKALNRQSQFDNLDELPAIVVSEVAKRRGEDKQKYNTLPINTGQTTCNGAPTTHQRKKRPSGHSLEGEISRNVSQKSGTYPSPDTDEDQRSIQPERKKKSAFKKFKERFISTVRRNSYSQKKNKTKPERGSPSSARGGRVRPNHTHSAAGFHTPSENGTKHQTLQNGHHGDMVDGSVQTLTSSVDHTEYHEDGKKKGGILTVIRNSFRRKSSPDLRHSKKDSSDSRPSSSETHPSPIRAGSYKPRTSSPIAIPTRQRTPDRLDEDEDPYAPDDTITAIFGSIIEPRRPSHTAADGSLAYAPAPDRSKLRLEGLRKCRPKSFERTDVAGNRGSGHSAGNRGSGHRYGYQASELSPTVETDGFDFADGPAEQLPRPSQAREEESDLLFYEVSQEEKQRRIDEVARCLAALGDRIAAEKDLQSGAESDVEGHRVGKMNSLERGIQRDLLHYADNHFKIGQSGVSVSTHLMPAVKNILAAQDYSNFKTVIQEELSKTNGWEQVAWYTYLIKTAVCIAETNVGGQVKSRAKKYFNAVLRPWIQSRPNGWESIHEETDIESEVD